MKDDVFVEGTAANLLVAELAAGREVLRPSQLPRCQIKGPKTRIGGHLGVMAGVSMIGLSTTEPCPIARVIDLMNAFRNVNAAWLLTTQAKAKKGVSGLGQTRRGENGNRFLKDRLG